LDNIRPFSDTIAVDIVLRDAENILSSDLEAVGSKNSARIWGFISKFVMLDRFLEPLGLAVVHPGTPFPRTIQSRKYLGTAVKVIFFLPKSLTFLTWFKILEELTPPTKIIRKFMQTWVDRDKNRSVYEKMSSTTPTGEGDKPIEITLSLSRQLIAVVKVKKILHIEAGLEMIALAMAISSKVSYIYILDVSKFFLQLERWGISRKAF
jgi:hypothetical protein